MTSELPFAFRARFSDDERARFDEQVSRFLRSVRFVSDAGNVDEATKLATHPRSARAAELYVSFYRQRP